MFKKFISQDVSTSQTNNDTGWTSGWGLNSRPQQQGLLSARQSPQIVQEKTGFLGGLGAGFLIQPSTKEQGNRGEEDEYERKMRGKRRLDDLEWFAEYLNGKNPQDLDEDEQYGSLLMGLHNGGAKLDENELNELRLLAGKTRQQEELKEQERSIPRQRKRADDLTEEELMEIEIFNKQREEGEVEEYLELLDAKENGEEVDLVRLKILDAIDKKNCGETLTEEENVLLKSYQDGVMETHLDRIEMKFLVSLKQEGRKFDEDRLRELELRHLQKQRIPLSDEELEELSWFDRKRLREEKCLEELIEMKENQATREEVDEKHALFLELLHRKLDGQLLGDSDLDEIARIQKQWKEESRRQKSSTSDKLSKKELEANQKKTDQSLDVDVLDDAPSPKSGKTNSSLGSKDLRQIGLPPTIEVSSVGSFDHSAASIGGLSGSSYVEDLMAQRDLRHEEREEEAFDEALDLYEAKLRETNQPENEQLFSRIYQEMKTKSRKRHETEDKIADELLNEATKEYEVQRKKLKAERSALRAHQGECQTDPEKSLQTEDGRHENEPVTKQDNTAKGQEDEVPSVTEEKESMVANTNAEMTTPSVEAEASSGAPNGNDDITMERNDDDGSTSKAGKDRDNADAEELRDLLERFDRGEDIDEDRLYELELLERHRMGESLSSVEREDVEALLKARDGKSKGPDHITEGQDGGDLFRFPSLVEESCRLELGRLRTAMFAKEVVDEAKLCLLELQDVQSRGYILTDEEEYEMELLLSHFEGGSLTQEETDDMEFFIKKRVMYNELDVMLNEIRSKQEDREKAEEDLLFELELFERARKREDLTKMEKLAVELLERNRMGEALTDCEMDDYLDLMEILKNERTNDSEKTEGSSRLLSEDDMEYLGILRTSEREGKQLSDLELFELSVLERQEKGETMDADELDEFMLVKRRRKHGNELLSLRTLRDKGEEYDADRLYELELFERNRKGLPLNDDELYEFQIFEKRRDGETLEDEELEDLELMRQQRESDDRERQQLQDDKRNGIGIDEDLLWELELLYRNRNGFGLGTDERRELEIIVRKRNGEQLTDADREELELLKAIREENALDEKELMDLRERKANGELVDENLLYELELFQRMRQGDSLTEDELFELSCFESRRAGEDLDEADLDELDRLKRVRLVSHGAKEEAINNDDDDSLYMHRLKEKVRKGKMLTLSESRELALIQRKRRGEELEKHELDELANLRSKRQEASTDSQGLADGVHVSGSDDRKNHEKVRKVKKAGHQRKIPQNTKTEKEKVKLVDHMSSGPSTMKSERIQPPLPFAPSTQHVPPPPPVAATPSGFLGGFFGGRKKREEELEAQRRQQEEVIRQQLQAMNLQEELKELEEKQIVQEELVRNTIEQKRNEVVMLNGSSSSLDQHSDQQDPQLESPVVSEVEDSDGQESIGEEDDAEKVEDAEEIPQEFSFVKKRAEKMKATTSATEKRIGDENKKAGPHNDSNSQKNKGAQILHQSFEKHLSSTLTAHLAAHGQHVDTINRFGDELSVGLSQDEDEEEVAEGKADTVPFSRDTDKSHPWRASAEERDSRRVNRNRIVAATDEEEKMIEDGLVDEVFDTSLFNFDTQFDTGVFLDQEEEESINEAKYGEEKEDEQKEEEKEEENSNAEEKDEPGASNNEPEQADEIGSAVKSEGSGHQEEDDSLHEMDFSNRSSNIRDLNLMQSLSMLQFTDLTAYEYDGIESKFGEKKSDDAKFLETWANEKADKAAVAQFNQMRYARERAELKKQEADMEAVPRLFLFEGERIRNKKKRRHLPKNRKKRKKLESKLSREFRKAMESVFDSDSEEEYDVDLDGGNNEREVMMKMSRRLSNDSIVFDDLSVSSHASEGPEEENEAKPEDDFLETLREQSMQNENATSTVNDNKTTGGSTFKSGTVFGDEISQISEQSNLDAIPEGAESVSTNGSGRQKSVASRSRRTGKTSNTGKSSKSADVDPASVYAQEVEKSKERKKNSISDFRKEMEDLIKRGAGLETPDIDSLIAPNDFTMQNKSMVFERQKSRMMSKQRSQRSGRFALATGRAPHKQSSFESLLMRKDPIQEDITFDAFNTNELQSNDAHVALVGSNQSGIVGATSGNTFSERGPTRAEEEIEPGSEKKRNKRGINLKESGAKLKKLAGKAGKAIPVATFSRLPAFGRKNTHQNMQDDGSFGQGLLG